MTMRWLTLSLIKAHLRIDGDGEDEYLELLGESAEETVLNFIGRSYEELIKLYGVSDGTGKKVPTPIVEASLMLCLNSYENRGVASVNALYTVPYGFDARVKPYIKLTRG